MNTLIVVILLLILAVEVVSLVNNWMVINRNYKTSDRTIRLLEEENRHLRLVNKGQASDNAHLRKGKLDHAFIIHSGGIIACPSGWVEKYDEVFPRQ
jgi:hypothetical protein